MVGRGKRQLMNIKYALIIGATKGLLTPKVVIPDDRPRLIKAVIT